MPYTPTLTELRAAFRQARLWATGMSFHQALAAPEVLAGLICQVVAERRRLERQQGKPAPVQPALFQERA